MSEDSYASRAVNGVDNFFYADELRLYYNIFRAVGAEKFVIYIAVKILSDAAFDECVHNVLLKDSGRTGGAFHDKLGGDRITLSRLENHILPRFFARGVVLVAELLEPVRTVAEVTENMYLTAGFGIRCGQFNAGDNGHSASCGDDPAADGTRLAVMVCDRNGIDAAFFCEHNKVVNTHGTV